MKGYHDTSTGPVRWPGFFDGVRSSAWPRGRARGHEHGASVEIDAAVGAHGDHPPVHHHARSSGRLDAVRCGSMRFDARRVVHGPRSSASSSSTRALEHRERQPDHRGGRPHPRARHGTADDERSAPRCVARFAPAPRASRSRVHPVRGTSPSANALASYRPGVGGQEPRRGSRLYAHVRCSRAVAIAWMGLRPI